MDAVPRDLLAQLSANRLVIEGDAPKHMQALFPEGFYFCYLFHGLTWVELAMRDEKHASDAIEQAKWCRDHLDSDAGKAPFPPHLPPDHGMFYFAWRTHLQAGIVCLQNGHDPVELARLQNECDQLAEALKNANSPFLASYDNAVWPCDTIPAIQAMATFDRVCKTDRYRSFVKDWVTQSQDRLDPETDLIPHTTNPATGKPTSVGRATSQMILLRMLPDIDAAFAREQYEKFRSRFVKPLLSMPSVLEYPSGIRGRGDVDSGPLIFGRSLSATVMMIGVAQIYGDQDQADVIATVGEVVGLPWTWKNRKRYVGGVLPVGDIIVAYSQVARSWTSDRSHQTTKPRPVSSFWRLPVHAISLFLALFPVVISRFLGLTNTVSKV